MTRTLARLIDIQITDMLDKAAQGFERQFGTVNSYPVRRMLLKQIKEDLIRIMADAVEISLDYFYEGKPRDKMDRYLRKGIQVKGQSLNSIRAILYGVDYTITHEQNTTIFPKKKIMLAIPLPDACRSDGTPKLSSPIKWKNTVNTFIISGEKAVNQFNRHPVATPINPHSEKEIAYIVYKHKRDHKLIYLYKLVPYSIFNEGYSNYKGRPLKKLGLRARIEAGIQSAIPGWYSLIWGALTSIPRFDNLKVYNDIHIYDTVIPYQSTYNKGNIPRGRVSQSLITNISNFAFMSSKILTM